MQFSVDFTGRALRNVGMARATDHADSVEPGWSDRAFEALTRFVGSVRTPFLGEDVRKFAYDGGLPRPPHERAWGGVLAKAARRGLITRAGFAPVSNPLAHCTPATLWRTQL